MQILNTEILEITAPEQLFAKLKAQNIVLKCQEWNIVGIMLMNFG